MYAVLETDGKFSGVVYDVMSDKIEKHHTQYGQTFIEVIEAPVDVAPISGDPDELGYVHDFDYGSPSPEQLEAHRIRTSNKVHEDYLISTNWVVMRKVETGEAIPVDVLTKRTEARTALGR